MATSKIVRIDKWDYQVVHSEEFGFGVQSRYMDGDITEDWVDVEVCPKEEFGLAMAKIFNIHLES